MSVLREATALASHGITFGEAHIDIDKLRQYKDGVVRKLTSGLGGMGKARKVEVIQGHGRFIDSHHLLVTLPDGQVKRVRFEKAIIAAGSEPVRLPFMPEDPRVIDSTGALKLPSQCKRMLVIGGGIIGLEMATVAYLGVCTDLPPQRKH